MGKTDCNSQLFTDAFTLPHRKLMSSIQPCHTSKEGVIAKMVDSKRTTYITIKLGVKSISLYFLSLLNYFFVLWHTCKEDKKKIDTVSGFKFKCKQYQTLALTPNNGNKGWKRCNGLGQEGKPTNSLRMVDKKILNCKKSYK